MVEIKSLVLGKGVLSVIIKVMGLVLGVVANVILARFMGAESYGIYAFVYAIVVLLAIPCQAGLPQLLLRETAVYVSKEQWGFLKGILVRSNQLVLIVSAVSICIFALFFYFSAYFEIKSFPIFFWAALIIPLAALGNIRGGILRGLKYTIIGQFPELIIRPLFFLIFIVLCVFVSSYDLTVMTVLQFNAIASIVAFFIGSVSLYFLLPFKIKKIATNYDTKSWLLSVIPFALLSSVQALNSNLDVVMLGFLSKSSEVASYKVASQSAQLVSFTLSAINMVLGPYVVKVYQTGDMASLQKLVTFSARVIALTALPSAFVFIVWSEEILLFVFGEEYVVAYKPMIILCFGQLINALMGSVLLLMNMMGRERKALIGVVVAGVANATLNLFLIPLYGATGAAISTMVTVSVWNVILSVQLYKTTDIYSLPIKINFWSNK